MNGREGFVGRRSARRERRGVRRVIGRVLRARALVRCLTRVVEGSKTDDESRRAVAEPLDLAPIPVMQSGISERCDELC